MIQVKVLLFRGVCMMSNSKICLLQRGEEDGQGMASLHAKFESGPFAPAEWKIFTDSIIHT